MGYETLIGLALTAAGAGTKMAAASSEQDAMNKATNLQLQEQQAFQKKGQEAFQQSLSQSTPQAAQQQQQAGAQQTLAASQAAKLPAIALPQNASGDNAQAIAYAGQDAKNQLAQRSNSQMQGYGNIGLQQYLKDLDAKSKLGVIGSQAQQSANLFPLMLQGAQNSEANLAGIGSLLGSAGALVGSTQGMWGNPAVTTPMSAIGNYPMANSMLNNARATQAIGNWATNPGLSTFNF